MDEMMRAAQKATDDIAETTSAMIDGSYPINSREKLNKMIDLIAESIKEGLSKEAVNKIAASLEKNKGDNKDITEKEVKENLIDGIGKMEKIAIPFFEIGIAFGEAVSSLDPEVGKETVSSIMGDIKWDKLDNPTYRKEVLSLFKAETAKIKERSSQQDGSSDKSSKNNPFDKLFGYIAILSEYDNVDRIMKLLRNNNERYAIKDLAHEFGFTPAQTKAIYTFDIKPFTKGKEYLKNELKELNEEFMMFKEEDIDNEVNPFRQKLAEEKEPIVVASAKEEVSSS